MLPNLDSLALFVRAAEAGSLTKAAADAHIATPAASRRLALLEHQFRTRLFDRRPRGLELTAAGQCLLAHARTILGEVHRAQAEMANYATGRVAVLRVFANSSAMAQFLPDDIAAFQRARPDVRLVIDEVWSDAAAQAVRSGTAHLGVVLAGTPDDGLRCVAYRCDRLAVVLPDDHALAGETLALRDVIGYDLIVLESKSSMLRLVAHHAQELGEPLVLRAQVKSFEAVCRMVQAGLGIGLLPQRAAQSFESSMGLRVVPLSDPWARRRMLLCIRDNEPEPALRALVDYLSERGRDAAAPLPAGR